MYKPISKSIKQNQNMLKHSFKVNLINTIEIFIKHYKFCCKLI